MKHKEKVQKEFKEMYEKIEESYVHAGSLRDYFSHVDDTEKQGELKQYCNKIRNVLSELKSLKYSFKEEINQL